MEFKKFLPKLPHLFREILDERLKKEGIYVPFPMFLMGLIENEGVTLSELGSELMFDKAHISRTIASFEQEGYVEKRQDINDKRIFRLYITKKGREAVAIIRNIHDGLNKVLIDGVSHEDLAVCERVIIQIHQNLIKETEKKD